MAIMNKKKHPGNQLSQQKYRQATLYTNGAKKGYNKNNATHSETFSSGKSSNFMINEFRKKKLEYEKETGYSLTRREIGHRF